MSRIIARVSSKIAIYLLLVSGYIVNTLLSTQECEIRYVSGADEILIGIVTLARTLGRMRYVSLLLKAPDTIRHDKPCWQFKLSTIHQHFLARECLKKSV